MGNNLTKRRLAENQVVFRRRNESVQDRLDKTSRIADEEGAAVPAVDSTMMLYFYCECSDASCKKRIRVSLGDYNEIHAERDCFIVKGGHEIPAIEEVISRRDSYIVVRKFTKPPQSAKKLNYE